MSDPTIERIEAELRESRTQAWDVETFLANRHRAKFQELTAETDNPWQRRWAVTKELAFGFAAFVGYITIVTLGGLWLLLGHFPVERGMFDKPAVVQRIDPQSGLVMPPPAPPVYRNH